MKSRGCNCKYWKKEMKTIISALECADLFSKGIFKTKELTLFEYCPWCGNKLVESGEDIKEYTLDDNFIPKKRIINIVEK